MRETLLAVVGACALLATTVLLAPALADDGDQEGCCVCSGKVQQKATTSQVPAPAPIAPPGSVCLAGASNECSDTCQGDDLFFVPSACSAVAGCAQAGSKMAPIVSPTALAALGIALAGLGVYATRRI